MNEKLTPRMKTVLMEIFHSDNSLKINKGTIKSLIKRELIAENRTLTHEGWLQAMKFLSLKKQCELLELQCDIQKWEKDTKPECHAFDFFTKHGFVGSYCEAGGIGLVLKSLSLDALTATNVFKNDPEIARTRACLGGIVVLAHKDNDELEMVYEDIRRTDKAKFLASCEEILQYDMIHEWYPGLTIEFASAMFEALTKEIYVKIAKWISISTEHRNGWPDLTLVKNGKIKFVEVKTSDKLHRSQLITMPALKNKLELDVSILKLSKKKTEKNNS
jgi:hypothetical protein